MHIVNIVTIFDLKCFGDLLRGRFCENNMVVKELKYVQKT